jgi:hypothetical protein
MGARGSSPTSAHDPTYQPDVHANTTGYGVIAQAFEQVLP